MDETFSSFDFENALVLSGGLWKARVVAAVVFGSLLSAVERANGRRRTKAMANTGEGALEDRGLILISSSCDSR